MAPDADSDSELENFQSEEPRSESEGEPEYDFATFTSKSSRETSELSAQGIYITECQNYASALLTQDEAACFLTEDVEIAPNNHTFLD